MNKKQLFLGLVLLDFAALTGWALYSHGVVGWVSALLATPIGITAAVDLVIALGLVTAWMWKDAKRLGINPVPYMVATLCTGSIGPLAYLIRREWVDAPHRMALPAAA